MFANGFMVRASMSATWSILSNFSRLMNLGIGKFSVHNQNAAFMATVTTFSSLVATTATAFSKFFHSLGFDTNIRVRKRTVLKMCEKTTTFIHSVHAHALCTVCDNKLASAWTTQHGGLPCTGSLLDAVNLHDVLQRSICMPDGRLGLATFRHSILINFWPSRQLLR